jgi:hypothetical protein
VILRRVFDNPVAKQRPVLHQSEHTHVPPDRYWLARNLLCYERFGDKLQRLLYFMARSDAKRATPFADRAWNCHEL